MLMWRPAFRLLLAFLLVVSQQQAVLHALAHSVEELARSKNQVASHDEPCEKCVAFASLHNIVTGADAIVPQACGVTEQPRSVRFDDADCRLSLAYLSRAPPQRS
jgi:hypothetical protein